ncbi:two-component system response regulator WspF [Fluviicoccus keumensis]|uniref:Protein-glutamate methylesterase/protein-glutamine glutaminase n=1 Tax=Fluviicoccus keumensis TaxID=1435465 RepID=A0A4Q7ZCH8_9GAMM|nr:chemotaxis response regulator protein-glutamate methylesterase [Fluviicoccus keumensis]RZU47685.1 two-component system response regulator WspF [Fluviicoccus keumensis]
MKIAIVNDQTIAVEALRRALAFDNAHEILWVAANGAQAVENAVRQRPDIILMDLMMPVMDGVEATRQIMQRAPCAIIIVTSDTNRQVSRVFEAMGHGALDAVNTPVVGGDRAAIEPLLRKIGNVGLLIGQLEKRSSPSPLRRRPANMLIAIGASAGGPAAVAAVLKGLPAGFPAALVLVQHVDEVFAGSLAAWLATQCVLPVRLAREGEIPQAGTVLVAGTNHHIRLTLGGRLAYTPEPVQQVYRPSVDVFFESVARYWEGPAVGVLLTGMGRDGAKGLKMMRQSGLLTLTQDEKTSAVYGMPKAAVAIDAAMEVLPLEQMAPRLNRAAAQP